MRRKSSAKGNKSRNKSQCIYAMKWIRIGTWTYVQQHSVDECYTSTLCGDIIFVILSKLWKMTFRVPVACDNIMSESGNGTLFPVSDPSTYLSCSFSKTTTLHHETKRPPLNTDAIPIHFYLSLVNVTKMQKKIKKERERERKVHGTCKKYALGTCAHLHCESI